MVRIVLVCFCLLLGSEAYAQALPFVKEPQSQEALARAIEVGNQSVLNLSPNDYLRAANEALGLEIEDYKALASYIRRLKKVSCPVGYESTLGRVLKTGEVDLYGFKRKFVEGENCLLDTNTARYVVSLLCGNVITATGLPIFGAETTEYTSKAPADELPPVFTDRVNVGTTNPLAPSTTLDTSRSPDSSQKNSWFSKNKSWVIPAGVGVAVGTAAILAIKGRSVTVTQTVTIGGGI